MKKLTGKIVSLKMQKTAVVLLERQKIHPLYKKIIRRTHRIKVHSDIEGFEVGDMVQMVSVRPISKEKHYKIIGKI